MSFDIYGNYLKPGHCEVHPEVNQSYPCWKCDEEYFERKAHDKELEREYYKAMEEDYNNYLEEQYNGWIDLIDTFLSEYLDCMETNFCL